MLRLTVATKERPVDPSELDIGTLALFTGYALSDAVLEALRAAGHPKLRFSHGFVFQHLIEADRTIGELATRMDVTQQGASKAVKELEGLGYVERVADPADGRVRHVRLTRAGRDTVEAGRAIRRRLAARLAAKVGPARLEATRKTLVEILEEFSAGDAIRARRVRAPE